MSGNGLSDPKYPPAKIAFSAVLGDTTPDTYLYASSHQGESSCRHQIE